MGSTKRWERINKARRGFDLEVEVRVCGGFPVIALACAEPKDPEVGIFSDSFCDVTILTEDFGNADFITRKMSSRDWDRVNDALWGCLR